jgi:hypothetical protein
VGGSLCGQAVPASVLFGPGLSPDPVYCRPIRGWGLARPGSVCLVGLAYDVLIWSSLAGKSCLRPVRLPPGSGGLDLGSRLLHHLSLLRLGPGQPGQFGLLPLPAGLGSLAVCCPGLLLRGQVGGSGLIFGLPVGHLGGDLLRRCGPGVQHAPPLPQTVFLCRQLVAGLGLLLFLPAGLLSLLLAVALLPGHLLPGQRLLSDLLLELCSFCLYHCLLLLQLSRGGVIRLLHASVGVPGQSSASGQLVPPPGKVVQAWRLYWFQAGRAGYCFSRAAGGPD